MLYSLTGKAVKKGKDFILLNCPPFVFKIFLLKDEIKDIMLNKKARVFVFLYMNLAKKEGEINLYGFLKEEKRELFAILNSLKGIGPKLSLKIIESASCDRIKKAIEKKDVSFFDSVLKLGKRRRGKLFKLTKEQEGQFEQLRQGLLNLGYSKREINKVLKSTSLTSDLKENFKKVLKKLTKNR